ncbi:MAG: class I SAM-dependent methyltransferase [Ardenticatenales bacterium]|nr:class I SAM-dependent methyltransferase [Ardenticatenales bacterium]
MTLSPMNDRPPVCDYEGSDYRTRFWEQGGRDYEDLAERQALRRLMPQRGDTLLDIGAGFGRLADEYAGYKRVVLFDYSRTLLREAQARLGDDPRFIYVAGDWYRMPFVDNLFDTMVQVRTIHHAADVPALMRQLVRIARPKGSYVLEFANKRNLKAMLRYLLGRQSWSPYAPEPVEFVELNFDFHPTWMLAQLAAVGFKPGQILTVSHFRLAILKRLVPTRLLTALDGLLARTGNWIQYSPSVFVQNQAPAGRSAKATTDFFACPSCGSPLPAEPVAGALVCQAPTCGNRWAVVDGLYDFKQPL